MSRQSHAPLGNCAAELELEVLRFGFKKENYFYFLHSTVGLPFCAAWVLNFPVLQEGDRRDVAARREARAAGGGRQERPLPLPQSTPPRSVRSNRLTSTGTRGNFARTTRSHNAAPPAGRVADVTVHTPSREEAADTSKHLVTVCAAGR